MLPKPEQGEDESAFVKRCLDDADAVREYPDEKIREVVLRGQHAKQARQGRRTGGGAIVACRENPNWEAEARSSPRIKMPRRTGAGWG